MSTEQAYDHYESKYGNESFQQIRSSANKPARAPSGRRKGKAPQSFNGMHRRRRKKVSW